ncbi:hypothetical protein LCGC14_2496350, partial [marine sediment metagenome]
IGFVIKALSDYALEVGGMNALLQAYEFWIGRGVEATEELDDATAAAFAIAAEQAEILAGQRALAVKADFAAAAVRERLAEEAAKRAAEEAKALAQQVIDVDKAAEAWLRLTDAKQAVIKNEIDLSKAYRATNEVIKNQEEAIGLTTDAILGQVSTTLSAVTKVFGASKGSAIAQIAIDTLRNSISLLAPPPLGLGLAGPPFAIAQGALATAAVLKSKPPSFHIGGVVPEDAPRLPGGGPRDRLAIVEPGERITPEGQGGGGIRAFIQLGHRTIEQAVMMSMDGGVLEGFDEPEFLGQARFSESR